MNKVLPAGNLAALYLISMPIGNPEDISLRALKILKQVPMIIVEEYPQGKKNLEMLGIDLFQKTILELNEHVENRNQLGQADLPFKKKRDPHWQDFLNEVLGVTAAALISDGGTPILADPGSRLLEELWNRGVSITHVGGACSILSGLLLSRFSIDRFYYAGFLPANHNQREQSLKKLFRINELLVIMETPYRLAPLLSSLLRVFPPLTPITLAFSLSTPEEEIFHATLLAAVKEYREAGKNRRPFVLFINNRKKISAAAGPPRHGRSQKRRQIRD